jgi:Concanavalin A-like lectin/glucanases superfamily
VWDRVLFDDEIAHMSDPLLVGRVGEWHMDEIGPGPAFDASGLGHDLTFHGGASIPPSGAGQTGTGLRLDGTSGYADTTGPVLYTDQSFTVSAWVRLADADPSTTAPDLPTGNHTALGQSGQRISGFFLGYRSFSSGTRWSFSMVDSDSDNPVWSSAASSTLVPTTDVGRWVHLVGVFDATNATMKLYVDGSLARSAPRPARWHAAGPLTIGAALWSPLGGAPRLTDWWPGDIDEVRVYAGVVADPTAIA